MGSKTQVRTTRISQTTGEAEHASKSDVVSRKLQNLDGKWAIWRKGDKHALTPSCRCTILKQHRVR